MQLNGRVLTSMRKALGLITSKTAIIHVEITKNMGQACAFKTILGNMF